MVPKVQPGQTLSISGSAKTHTVLPTLLIENTSLVYCHLYGFNTNREINLNSYNSIWMYDPTQTSATLSWSLKYCFLTNNKNCSRKSLLSSTSKSYPGYEQQVISKPSERITQSPSWFQLVGLIFALVFFSHLEEQQSCFYPRDPTDDHFQLISWLTLKIWYLSRFGNIIQDQHLLVADISF